MRKLFYARLAFSNLIKNARAYLPFILSSSITIAMCYILFMLPWDEGLRGAHGEVYLTSILWLGASVVSIFAVVFLFYTSSFLIKRRKAEFGLLNVLGMEKKHIARVLLFENFYLGAASLLLGLVLGFALSKAAVLLLINLIGLDVRFGLSFCLPAAGTTLLLFGAIFLLILLNSIRQVHFSSAVELLRGGNVGEREPKTKWLLTLIGLLTLGGGYAIALTTTNPAEALMLFFVAVILVIAGTYCLFTAGSVSLLKCLRRNKKYYYKPEHFVSISGMLYRMKQNAVGLANICILSTMVLVMLSSTISLFAGTEDMISRLHPREIGAETAMRNGASRELDDMESQVVLAAAETGVSPSNWLEYRRLIFAVRQEGDAFALGFDENFSDSSATGLVFMPLEDFNRLTGRSDSLQSGQVLAFPYEKDKLKVLDYAFEVVPAEGLGEISMPSSYYASMMDTVHVIVPDSETIWEIAARQQEVYGDAASSYEAYAGFDLPDLEGEAKVQAFETFAKAMERQGFEGRLRSREASREEVYAMNGSLFFLGLFLGLLFLMAVVLIMYYKQLSEGYDDKRRFAIMRKVGLRRSEIRRSIRSQVLILFYLPLLAACCHIAAAFPLISRMFLLVQLHNSRLFFLCTLASAALFALIYAAAYALTARTYYRIVGEDR